MVERGVQVEALLDDGDEDVDRNGNPLVVRCAAKSDIGARTAPAQQ